MGARLDQVRLSAQLAEHLALVELHRRRRREVVVIGGPLLSCSVLRCRRSGNGSGRRIPRPTSAVSLLHDGPEARVQVAELAKAGLLRRPVFPIVVTGEPVSAEVVAVQVRGGDLGGGVVALEDELVFGQPGGVGEACVDDAQGQVVEAAVDAGEGEELCGWEGGEDLDEDL